MTAQQEPWHGVTPSLAERYRAIDADEYGRLLEHIRTVAGLNWEVAGTLSSGEVRITEHPERREVCSNTWAAAMADAEKRAARPKPKKRKKRKKH